MCGFAGCSEIAFGGAHCAPSLPRSWCVSLPRSIWGLEGLSLGPPSSGGGTTGSTRLTRRRLDPGPAKPCRPPLAPANLWFAAHGVGTQPPILRQVLGQKAVKRRPPTTSIAMACATPTAPLKPWHGRGVRTRDAKRGAHASR